VIGTYSPPNDAALPRRRGWGKCDCAHEDFRYLETAAMSLAWGGSLVTLRLGGFVREFARVLAPLGVRA